MKSQEAEPTPESCLEPTRFIDSDAPCIRDMVAAMNLEGMPVKEKAISLFRHVRDEIDYEFMIRFSPEEYCASYTLGDGKGFCVRKSVLLCALARAANIPAALVLSDMRDFSLSPKVVLALGTNIMHHHGLTALYIEGKWLKVDASLSPNIVSRKKYRPVICDGESDALHRSTTLEGKPHAEYLKFYGLYEDLPYDQMMEAFHIGYKDANLDMLGKLGLE